MSAEIFRRIRNGDISMYYEEDKLTPQQALMLEITISFVESMDTMINTASVVGTLIFGALFGLFGIFNSSFWDDLEQIMISNGCDELFRGTYKFVSNTFYCTGVCSIMVVLLTYSYYLNHEQGKRSFLIKPSKVYLDDFKRILGQEVEEEENEDEDSFFFRFFNFLKKSKNDLANERKENQTIIPAPNQDAAKDIPGNLKDVNDNEDQKASIEKNKVEPPVPDFLLEDLIYKVRNKMIIWNIISYLGIISVVGVFILMMEVMRISMIPSADVCSGGGSTAAEYASWIIFAYFGAIYGLNIFGRFTEPVGQLYVLFDFAKKYEFDNKKLKYVDSVISSLLNAAIPQTFAYLLVFLFIFVINTGI